MTIEPDSKFQAFQLEAGIESFDLLSLEGAAFTVAGLACRLFFPPAYPALLSIGASLCAVHLAIKLLSCYDDAMVLGLTKEACKVNRKYPKLHLISFIFSIAIGFVSKTVAFLTGIAIGSFAAVILEVENYKYLQRTDRKAREVKCPYTN
jgi:hypothetical protein